MSPVWFITAASSGFGHQMAIEALSRGHTVIATARKESRVQDLKEKGAHTMAFDVTSPLSSIEATASKVFAQFGRVDYLINAAGYILEGAVEECSPQEVQDMFNTNVFGIVNTVKAFLPHMRSQALADDGVRGTLVAFGSLGSWEGGACYSAYAMTKFSVSALMESLRIEMTPFQINVTVVEPGYFRTGFLNPTARVSSRDVIPAYSAPDTPTGMVRKALVKTDGNQPGDVVKGSKVAVEVLTRTGFAAGKTVPVRIPLGTDCIATIQHKISSTQDILSEWGELISSTDYPKGQQ